MIVFSKKTELQPIRDQGDVFKCLVLFNKSKSPKPKDIQLTIITNAHICHFFTEMMTEK